jgi:sec-independent protein translocase protein TatA
MNLMGPDMMLILLIVLLLFGAKKLPELARGMGRAVKEFGAARDEVERELSQSGRDAIAPPKLLDTKSELSLRGSPSGINTVRDGFSPAPSLQKELDDRSGNS